MKMTGAQMVWESLVQEGVDVVFGLPGGAVLPLYDALAKYEYPVHHVLVTHEQGASHMADGYARATGRVGVCASTEAAAVPNGFWRRGGHHTTAASQPSLHPTRCDCRRQSSPPQSSRGAMDSWFRFLVFFPRASCTGWGLPARATWPYVA